MKTDIKAFAANLEKLIRDLDKIEPGSLVRFKSRFGSDLSDGTIIRMFRHYTVPQENTHTSKSLTEIDAVIFLGRKKSETLDIDDKFLFLIDDELYEWNDIIVDASIYVEVLSSSSDLCQS